MLRNPLLAAPGPSNYTIVYQSWRNPLPTQSLMTDTLFIVFNPVIDRKHCRLQPGLEQPLPQYPIASDLGITPVTPSPIRKLER